MRSFWSPRWLQDGPKMAQDGPKITQVGPEMAQDSPRRRRMCFASVCLKILEAVMGVRGCPTREHPNAPRGRGGVGEGLHAFSFWCGHLLSRLICSCLSKVFSLEPSSLELRRQYLPCLALSCLPLRLCWGYLWAPLDRLGAILGPSWDYLGPTLRPPGASLVPPWSHLDATLEPAQPCPQASPRWRQDS